MKMLKKDIVSVIIIILIVFGINILTEKIMSNSIYEVKSIANEIQKGLDKKIDAEKIHELDKKWREKEKILACFSEHDELEKVSKEVNSLVTSFEDDTKYVIKEKLDQIKFLLSHIEEKNKLKLKNIF